MCYGVKPKSLICIHSRPILSLVNWHLYILMFYLLTQNIRVCHTHYWCSSIFYLIPRHCLQLWYHWLDGQLKWFQKLQLASGVNSKSDSQTSVYTHSSAQCLNTSKSDVAVSQGHQFIWRRFVYLGVTNGASQQYHYRNIVYCLCNLKYWHKCIKNESDS